MSKVINNNENIKRENIFEVFASKVTVSKAIAGIEHVTDIQMDLIIMMFDALLEAGTVQLNDTQMFNYLKLKDQWYATKSVDLATATYEIDYAFNGNGDTTTLADGTIIPSPSGLKREARQAQKEYKQILKDHGYEF